MKFLLYILFTLLIPKCYCQQLIDISSIENRSKHIDLAGKLLMPYENESDSGFSMPDNELKYYVVKRKKLSKLEIAPQLHKILVDSFGALKFVTTYYFESNRLIKVIDAYYYSNKELNRSNTFYYTKEDWYTKTGACLPEFPNKNYHLMLARNYLNTFEKEKKHFRQ
ncbi:hypothetical protein [Ferruginibacter sp.]